MEGFIAIDCGKYATKVATYNTEEKTVNKFSFRTKTSTGDFADDALEHNTFIIQIGDLVYKIGNGAMDEAELETSKATDIHKNCTLAAIAMSIPATKESIPVNVAVGIPAKEWCVIEKRQQLKEYLLPDGDITIKIKTKSDKPVEEKHFHIVSKYIFAESVGALFLDKMEEYVDCSVGVIDIGNLNINGTIWDDFEISKKDTITDELGGNILIAGLTQELSAEFSRCSESYIAKILTLPPDQRKLVRNGIRDEELEKGSKKMIDTYLLQHVKKIRRRLDSKSWPLDFMPLCFIGGTSKLLANEIYSVFGERVYIPDNPEYANVLGFLRLLCGKRLNLVIPTHTTSKQPEKKEASNSTNKENKAEQKTA